MNATAAHRKEVAETLRGLIAALEAGDDGRFEAGLDALLRAREEGLFANVARLTRELHKAVLELRLDERLAQVAGDEIPDARHRLDYVMQVTEKAAHRTLDLVDQARTVTVGMQAAVERLDEAGALLREADHASVAVMLGEVRETLSDQSGHLRSTLSELAQAQEYQDIAGQIIKRVITLVRNVETALLELLRASGAGLQQRSERPIQALNGELPGPAVPGNGPAAASQEDADDLLASLGF
ncbi:MAG: protein phosphatase CheZ [Nevskiales bacterium]|nr:protein phosphatase CheZ [Nevskiales bacterium]